MEYVETLPESFMEIELALPVRQSGFRSRRESRIRSKAPACPSFRQLPTPSGLLRLH